MTPRSCANAGCLFAVAAALVLAANPAVPAPLNPPEAKGKANRLAQESSPYLLQHAHNPVNWYP